MMIRTRLSLWFTVLTAVALGITLVTVYALTVANTRNEFFDRLRERAAIAANVFLEKDELARTTLIEFNSRYLITLPQEVVFFIDSAGTHRFVETSNSPFQPSADLITRVRSQGSVKETDQGVQRYGIYYHDNQGSFVIIAQAYNRYGQSELDNLRIVLAGAFLAGLFLTWAAGVVFARRALQPMNNVISRVDSITASNLSARVEGGNQADEIGQLVRTFNNVLNRLEDSFNRQRSFIANASHELRTPLTNIIGQIEVQLAKARRIEESREANVHVLAEARRLSNIVDSLLVLAQADAGVLPIEFEPVRVDEVVFEVVSAAGRRHGQHRVVPHFVLDDDERNVTVRGHATLLRVALENLVDNAIKYSTQPVTIELRTSPGFVILKVIDVGIGMTEAQRSNLGTLFYRATEARSVDGFGIGIAIAQQLVALHHGELQFSSKPKQGTVATISFPVFNLDLE